MASRTLVSSALALIFLATSCKVPEASSPNTPASASDGIANGPVTADDPRAGSPGDASAAAPPSTARLVSLGPGPMFPVIAPPPT